MSLLEKTLGTACQDYSGGLVYENTPRCRPVCAARTWLGHTAIH